MARTTSSTAFSPSLLSFKGALFLIQMVSGLHSSLAVARRLLRCCTFSGLRWRQHSASVSHFCSYTAQTSLAFWLAELNTQLAWFRSAAHTCFRGVRPSEFSNLAETSAVHNAFFRFFTCTYTVYDKQLLPREEASVIRDATSGGARNLKSTEQRGDALAFVRRT